MNKNILLIEDEPVLRKMLGQRVQAMNYSYDLGATYGEAIGFLSANQYELIIADINLPDASGLTLVEWAKNNTINTDVIVMTGAVNEHDVNEALRMDCFGFMAKPFTIEEFQRVVKHALSSNIDDKIKDEDYARIDIDEFVCGKMLNFPVYIRLGKSRFLKIAHKDTDIEISRITSMKERGVYELWIDKKDLASYIALNEKLCKAPSVAQCSATMRVKLVKHYTEIICEEMRLFGISDNDIAKAIGSVQEMIKGISQIESIFKLISESSFKNLRFSKANILGVTFSVLTAHVLGWDSPRTISSIALGALLRDIGLIGKVANHDLLWNVRIKEDLRQMYFQHPKEGINLIKSFEKKGHEALNPAVLEIVEQHHENGTSDSFPSKIDRPNIFPPAFLVGMIDFFIENIFMKEEEKISLRIVHGLNEVLRRYGDDYRVIALKLLLKKGNVEAAKKEFERVRHLYAEDLKRN